MNRQEVIAELEGFLNRTESQKMETPALSLKGCNLSGVDLRQLVFTHVDFTAANLTGADFTGCVFIKCNFTNANITRTRFYGSIFADCWGRATYRKMDATWVGIEVSNNMQTPYANSLAGFGGIRS